MPRGLFLGGAPLNVACHLSRQGIAALPISAVGRDFLGAEAWRRMQAWGLDLRLVARNSRRPTGTVRAFIDGTGAATYRIARHVAWDRITVGRGRLAAVAPAAVVFGSLALREQPNRRTLDTLFRAWPAALRVLDLNLRKPFDRGTGVAHALRAAQMVKLNDDELARMTGKPARTMDQIKRTACRFAAERGLSRMCVTAGARGAGLLWAGRWHWEKARPVEVRDTIGAGDAFLAGLLAALLVRGAAPGEALASACRLGEFVAARDGATPPYTCDARGRPRD